MSNFDLSWTPALNTRSAGVSAPIPRPVVMNAQACRWAQIGSVADNAHPSVRCSVQTFHSVPCTVSQSAAASLLTLTTCHRTASIISDSDGQQVLDLWCDVSVVQHVSIHRVFTACICVCVCCMRFKSMWFACASDFGQVFFTLDSASQGALVDKTCHRASTSAAGFFFGVRYSP
jgi:hypothetical protein